MSFRNVISPLYTKYLEWFCGSKGLERSVNGISCRMQPKFRKYFPPIFDPAVIEYFRSRIRPGDFCLNIGANLGVMAVQFGSMNGPNGKIALVEPNPETRNNLEIHLRMNQLLDRTTIIPFAIADCDGQAEFFCHQSDGMSRLGDANVGLRGLAKPIKVGVKTLDSILPISGEDPSVLMMDIEGFELAALDGGDNFFKRAFPKAMVVEFHPNVWTTAKTSKNNLDKFVERHRLKIVPLSGQIDVYSCHAHVAFEKSD